MNLLTNGLLGAGFLLLLVSIWWANWIAGIGFILGVWVAVAKAYRHGVYVGYEMGRRDGYLARKGIQFGRHYGDRNN